MSHQEITSFQYESLESTANGVVPILLAPLPSFADGPALRWELHDRLHQIDDLIDLGFMEDVSDEYSSYAREHHYRKFKVYEMTDIGIAMFRCGGPYLN